MTVDELLAAGFRIKQDPVASDRYGSAYRDTLQKRVEDEHGTRYQIDVVHLEIYQRTRPNVEMLIPQSEMSRDGQSFGIEMAGQETSLRQMSAFFADAWEYMRASYLSAPEPDPDIDPFGSWSPR